MSCSAFNYRIFMERRMRFLVAEAIFVWCIYILSIGPVGCLSYAYFHVAPADLWIYRPLAMVSHYSVFGIPLTWYCGWWNTPLTASTDTDLIEGIERTEKFEYCIPDEEESLHGPVFPISAHDSSNVDVRK